MGRCGEKGGDECSYRRDAVDLHATRLSAGILIVRGKYGNFCSTFWLDIQILRVLHNMKLSSKYTLLSSFFFRVLKTADMWEIVPWKISS